MVFIVNEKSAIKIFAKYRNVAAFTLGKSKGISENGLEVSYAKLNFLPDEDDINGIINGDINPKKVIRKAVKALWTPNADNQNICVSMAQLINIVAPDKSNRPKKGGPNILVFVTDDAEDDKNIKKKNKFMVRYLSALFHEFGIEPVTDEDVVKKLFKKKKKKVVEKVAKYMQKHKEVRISNEGHMLKKTLFTFFSIELHQSGLSRVDLDEVNKNTMRVLVKNLKNVYTNDNLQVICNMGMKSKEEGKMCKKLAKKNKKAVAAYKSLAEILASMDVKMPKVKHGYEKKKKKNGKPKMNVKKFEKFFMKRKNLPLLAMVFAHTACMTLGAEIGSSEYNKYMNKITGTVGIEGFPKAFTAAAKAYGKAENVTVG